MRISSGGIGPMIRASGSRTYAAAVAVFSGCWRPMVRGETPTATYDDEDHHADGDGEGLPGPVELLQAGVGDERGGRHLAGDADQQRHVEIAGRVGGDLRELGAAAPAAAYGLLGAEAGDAREARLRAGGEPGDDDQRRWHR